jgi:hypothetical protein
VPGPLRLLEDDRVTIATETVAEVALDGKVSILGANDAARSSFTAWAGDYLVALSPGLEVLGRWTADPQHRGHHATSPSRGLALLSGPDEVRLLDHAGRVRWRYPHPPWDSRRGFSSGCAWFDEAGQPYAVVPAASYDHCLVVCLDLDSGQPLAVTPIRARPQGIEPVHHPDGWVGLSEVEGQDAARAWWVRPAGQLPGQMRIEVLDGGWDDWVLVDVDPSGSKIITTAHLGGPLLVRSFPALEVVRSVDPPPGRHWDFSAFFAGNMIVAALLGDEYRFAAISPHDKIADLDEREATYLVAADQGTWLAASRTTIRRCRMAGSREQIPGQHDEQIPGQIALW